MMDTPHYESEIVSHIVEVYTRQTPGYTPENAYLKLEDYIDLFIEKGYCSKPALRWLKIKEDGLDCLQTITFLNRFYDESGLQFVPITTENGQFEFTTSNVQEFVVLNKLFLKSQLILLLNKKNKLS